MAIFPATPSLRTRVLPRFPANVVAGTGITITKSGGTYVFALTPITDLPLAGLANITSNRLLGRDAAGPGDVGEIAVSGGLGFTGQNSLEMTANQRIRAFPFNISGAPITTGIKGDLFVPFSCTVTRVTLLGDIAPVGTAFVLDIWKDTYANYPPTVADSITGTLQPTIAIGTTKASVFDMSTWTTTLTANDVLRFNVNTTATITRVYVGIDVVTV